jgi:acyl-CoA dehydrogenase
MSVSNLTGRFDRALEFRGLPPLPPEVRELRMEVRAFLAEQQAAGTFTPSCDAWLCGHSPEFSREVGRRGWLGMTWPTKYGGQGRSEMERFVVTEEMLAAGAPVGAHWGTERQLGPNILRYGSEAMKQRLLPRFARGEVQISAGMSEPDSGSDLGSLRARAVQVDGGWSVTGRKIWISHAHRSHLIVVLCRTGEDGDKPHDAISQLIVDLATPGITITPIALISGEHHFNEVAFDDVFVPDDMVLGEVNNGWAQVGAELTLERGGPDRFLSTFPLLAAFGDSGQQAEVGDVAAYGRLVSRIWPLRALSIGIVSRLAAGDDASLVAALVKDLGTRLEQQIPEVVRLADGQLDARTRELLAEAVVAAPGFTLRGGTSEILRTIVARSLTRP